MDFGVINETDGSGIVTAKYKVGTFTRDMTIATGAQAVTGVGFRPTYIEFTGAVPTDPNISHGASDGTNHISSYKDDANAAADVVTSANPILLFPTLGDTQRVTSIVFDADGFTLQWQKNGTPTGTALIGYKAFK